ncbi:Epoxyqueuosine reductase [Anaerolineales bacterium]|nr:Epoxyqueuosine reductase [Anaerolineales bacterium]
MTATLEQSIKEKARQLGFILAGVTSCKPPQDYSVFEKWLADGNHGAMNYLAEERSRIRRADPKQILPECKSILVLAFPYFPIQRQLSSFVIPPSSFRIASYALGDDYHEIILQRLKKLVEFIERQIGHPVPNRYYTDTGPILERELAQRAGLGWIGKNSMLINPKAGSTFFLAEILLGIELKSEETVITDHCGKCTRCITACPTQAILPNRTLDARRCISYLTIENKGDIPEELRSSMGDWIFGCDICQMACPWNRFSAQADSGLEPTPSLRSSAQDLTLSSVEFNQRFKRSPIKRAKRRGYLRNLAVAIGNNGNPDNIPLLEQTIQDDEPLVSKHAQWAIEKIQGKNEQTSHCDKQ